MPVWVEAVPDLPEYIHSPFAEQTHLTNAPLKWGEANLEEAPPKRFITTHNTPKHFLPGNLPEVCSLQCQPI
jgi:hypothetical protein